MPSSGFWHFVLWIHYLALSLWIGGIVFLSTIAAPAVHSSIIARPLAGELVSKMLRRLNLFEITCCFILMGTSLLSFHFIPGAGRGILALVFLVLMMGLFSAFYAFSLTPRMQSLREKIPTLDSLSSGHAAKLEFDRMHKLYVRLMSLNLALGMIVLYMSVVLLK